MTLTTKIITRFAGAALFAAAAVWLARADYTSEVLSQNPVAYWNFGGAPTSPPLNVVANATGKSALNGYAVGTLGQGQPGIVGTAISFTNTVGTAHLGAKIDVPWNSAINVPQFSVEFWAKPSATTLSSAFDATGSCPISNFNPFSATTGRAGWLFYLPPTGRWNFWLGLTSGYAVQLAATNNLANATANTWQHIVGTYDGTNVSLYVNGIKVGGAVSLASSTGWLPNSGSFLRFGGTPLPGDTAIFANNNPINGILQTGSGFYTPLLAAYSPAQPQRGGNRGWDGSLDEMAIYTNVLSAAMINAHYAAATTNNAGYSAQISADGPAAYWPANGAAVSDPGPASYPTVANLGTAGSGADAKAGWGSLVGQAGPGYAGFSSSSNAVLLDGVSGQVKVGNTPALQVSGNVSYAAWVKPQATDYFRDIIAQGFDGYESENFLSIVRYSDIQYYTVGSSDGLNGYGYDNAWYPIPAGDTGNWVFLVGTFDGANWNLYRNGNLVDSIAASVLGPVSMTNSWSIGSRSEPTIGQGLYFGGSIAEPAIFTNALTAAEVLALYNAAGVPPVITRAPSVTGTVFKGSTVSLSVWAEGSPTLGYQWISNGVPTSVTATNFVISSIAAGNYNISVVITNAYGTNSATVSFAAVDQPPFITTQPAPVIRYVGYPFTLSVAAGGSAPLTYYWSQNGTVVQAGSSATYTKVATLTDAGSYTVVISNSTSINKTSAPTAVVVKPIPTDYPANAYITNVLGSAPIAYWRLDESSGSIAYDSVGGNDGVYNAATLGLPGYSGLDSDTAAGFSGVNSYVGNISGSAINFTAGNTAFTLEAWVKGPAGQADQASIIAKGIGDSGTTRNEQFALDVNGGSYHFFTTRSGTAYEISASTGPNDTWQHVVGVYYQTNLYIYVNGTLEGTAAGPAGSLSPITSPVTIGSKRTGNAPNYDGTFNGTIDEVAIYDHALDADTILAHYASIYGNNTAPFFTIQPKPAINYFGLPVTLFAGAAGSLPLHYQWYHGSEPVGEDSATFTIPAVALEDAGSYYVTAYNNVGSTNSLTNAVVVLPVPTNAPAFSDLVVHLPLTNIDLSTASIQMDITGRGNNGTNINNPLSGGNSPLGLPSLHYSTPFTNAGTASYVTLGVRPDLSFSSNVSFTVAFWIHLPDNYQGGDLPFFTDTIGSTFGTGFLFAPTYGYFATANPGTDTKIDGGWAFSVFDGSGAGVGGHGPENQINYGWNHLIYVIDRTKGTTVYVNGVPAQFTRQQGTSITSAGDIDTGNPATIGQDPTGNYGEIGSADIADLGVWRKALTPLEAASIYVAGYYNQLSFTGLPTIKINPISASQLQIIWSDGTLQSASSVAGPYADVSAATSPYTVNTTGSAKAFYRVRK